MQVEVDLPNHPYHIKIEEGCFSEAGDWVSHLWQKQMITIITDSNVEILYGESLVNQLKNKVLQYMFLVLLRVKLVKLWKLLIVFMVF